MLRVPKVVLAQQPFEPLARAFGVACDHDLPFLPARANVVRQRVEQADVLLLPLRREVAPDPAAGIGHAGPRRLGQDDELQHPARRRRVLPRVIVEVEQVRLGRLIDAVEARARLHRLQPVLVGVLDQLRSREADGRRMVVEADRRLGQVVEERLEPLVEKRQPVFHALMLAACADRLVERIVGAGRAEGGPVVLPEPGDRRLVEDDFRDGRELHDAQRLRRPLRGGVEPLCGLQSIAEEIEAHRPPLARQPDVDDASADRVVARLGDRRRLRKAHPGEERSQRRLVDPVPDPGGEGCLAQHLAGRNPLGDGVQRGQEHKGTRHSLCEPRQRRHPVRRDIVVRRDAVVGQAIPRREGQHRHLRREERQGRLHRREPLVVAGDVDDRLARSLSSAATRRASNPSGAPLTVMCCCFGMAVT